MADIDFLYVHNTDLNSAKESAKSLIDDFLQSNAKMVKDSSTAADGLSGEFKGKGFSGKWFVDAEKLGINVSLSFMLKALKGKVESELKKKVSRRFPDGHQV